MKRWGLGLLGAVAIGAAGLLLGSGEKPQAQTDAHSPDHDCAPGVLRIGVREPLKPLNPFVTNSTYSAQLHKLVFDGLMRFGLDGELEPCLAESVERSKDGRTLTFALRQNVRFHDGTPLTAEDVAFSYRTYLKGQEVRRGHLESIRAVEVHTPHSISLHFKKKAWLHVGLAEVLPRHLAADPIRFQEQPVGTGPFRFHSHRGDGGAVLADNPSYHLRPPHIKRIIVKVIPPSEERQWQAFIRNRVDLMDHISHTVIDQLVATKQAQKTEVPMAWNYVLVLNAQRETTNSSAVRKRIRNALLQPELCGAITNRNYAPIQGLFTDHPSKAAAMPALPPVDQPIRLALQFDGRNPIQRDLALGIRQQLEAVQIQTQLIPTGKDQESCNAFLFAIPPSHMPPAIKFSFWRRQVKLSQLMPSRIPKINTLLSHTVEESEITHDLLTQFEAILTEEALAIPLATPIEAVVSSKRLIADLNRYHKSNYSAAAVVEWRTQCTATTNHHRVERSL
ncbi:MAG: ABC transporter substrate-binding protein [Planctomycetota bacterium]|jgi:ABC-type transport system substrate-binding protein